MGMQLLRTGSIGNVNLLSAKTATPVRPSRCFASVPRARLFFVPSNSPRGSNLSGISAPGARELGFRRMIVGGNGNGRRVGAPKVSSGNSVQKSEEEWRAVLSPEQFYILRQKGTEYDH